MKKLGNKGQKWLKILHVYFACVWVGCATALMVMQFFIKAKNGGELYGILYTLDFVDLFILVPGAIGVFLTALVFSIWTNWGWFKHHWITVKWIICVYGMIFGTFWLGPWLSGMADIAEEQGLQALSNLDYLSHRHHSMIFGTFQVLTIIFAVIISVRKPWKRKTKTEKKPFNKMK